MSEQPLTSRRVSRSRAVRKRPDGEARQGHLLDR